MAKLTARGATVLARINCEKQNAEGETIKRSYAVRSDGKVLHRYGGELGTGWSIRSTWKPEDGKRTPEAALALLHRIARALHYTVTKEEVA